MANVAHASLTGANLHEPKGADAALTSQVYVSDGAGSGTWTNVSSLETSPSQNSFAQMLHVRRENTAIQSLSTGVWSNQSITTIVSNGILGAGLSDPFITLPAGDYMVMATFPAYRCGKIAIRLWNATTSTALLSGGQGYSAITSDTLTRAELKGKFTLAATYAVTLQYITDNGGFGDVTSSINTGVTSEVLIWKVG